MSELIRVPDIGSGEGEVIELFVKVGDRIEADQSILTLESDKASMEVPAPKAGVIKSLKVKLGDRLKEGDELLELEVEGAAEAAPAPAAAPAAKAEAKPAAAPAAAAPAAAPAAASVQQVHVPDIGSSGKAQIIEIQVKVGDTVEADQSLITLESDKASMEIPSPAAGVVKAISVKLNDEVGTGDLILDLEVAGAAAPAAAAPAQAAPLYPVIPGRLISINGEPVHDIVSKDSSADFVIQLDRNTLNHTGGWRWNFHAGLVGLESDQGLISLNGIAGLDQDFDDFSFARRADIRDMNVLDGSSGRCSRGRRGLGSRSSRFFGRSRSCSRGRCFRRRSGALGFQFQQFVAFFQAVAQLDLQALDDTGLGSRDFHARLVRLQGQDALIGFDTVADLYKQFDDFAVTAADVRYSNEFAHKNSPQQSSGLRFSGLMPNLTMASATTFGSISPRSANASRAANTTK